VFPFPFGGTGVTKFLGATRMDANSMDAAANVPTAQKRDMGLWRYEANFRGGKYIVLRRDGTVFSEPNFVLGPRDPASPGTMRFYAAECISLGTGNPLYINDCLRLAKDMEEIRKRDGDGDAGKGPHRLDHPKVIAQMMNTELRILAPLAGAKQRHVRVAKEIVALIASAESAGGITVRIAALLAKDEAEGID
jgi:hypothetical protein